MPKTKPHDVVQPADRNKKKVGNSVWKNRIQFSKQSKIFQFYVSCHAMTIGI